MQHKTPTNNTKQPPRLTDREKMVASRKHLRSWCIWHPAVTKPEEDPYNLQAVVSRQLIEFPDDVQHLPLNEL